MTYTRSHLSVTAWLCLAAIALLAQGCSPQATTTTTWSGVYRVDTAGPAKLCVAPNVSPPDGLGVNAQMQVSSEGGWCGITANRNGGPFDSYLLVTRPKHGKVYAHHVGTYTRVDYTPDTGYVGTDSFALHLIPGDGTLEVGVTVTR